MKLIESETRFPGIEPAPLDTVGLQLSPKITEDLRQFATEPTAMGQREKKGGASEGTQVTGVAIDRGGGSLSKGAPRPTLDPQVRLLDLLVPREIAKEALQVYERHLMGNQGPVYALQQAFVYIAEAEGWRRGER